MKARGETWCFSRSDLDPSIFFIRTNSILFWHEAAVNRTTLKIVKMRGSKCNSFPYCNKYDKQVLRFPFFSLGCLENGAALTEFAGHPPAFLFFKMCKLNFFNIYLFIYLNFFRQFFSSIFIYLPEQYYLWGLQYYQNQVLRMNWNMNT